MRGRAKSKTTWKTDGLDTERIVQRLTPRELEVLQLMVDGLSDKEIGDELCISELTVKHPHRLEIYAKFGVHSRIQCVNFARRMGFLPANEQPSTSREAMAFAQQYLAMAQRLAREGK